jgi:hypothetical protein
MKIILNEYPIPERGTFQIEETVTIQISAKEAQRQVNRWLLNEVSYMMGADLPTLVLGEQTVWHVPAYFSAPHVGRVGLVGIVQVDVLTGEMDAGPERKAEIEKRACELAADLPRFQPREAPEEYVARNVQPTHKPGRPPGNPFDLISKKR